MRETVSLVSVKEKMQVIKGAGKHIPILNAFSACVLDTRRVKGANYCTCSRLDES